MNHKNIRIHNIQNWNNPECFRLQLKSNLCFLHSAVAVKGKSIALAKHNLLYSQKERPYEFYKFVKVTALIQILTQSNATRSVD
jgi:hypothetical protein